MRRVDTFLSHADEDKLIARKLADALANYDFQVFVAHDDIGIGDEWESTLKKRIDQSELFLALISTNFHKAQYTDHEVGIAIAYNKRIFPIRIDESKPYGFMAKFQAQKISPEIIKNEVSNLAQRMMSFTDEGKEIIDSIIKDFSSSRSYDDANEKSRLLFTFSNFSNGQINEIADGYLSNDQIRYGWTEGPESLEFLAKNWNSLTEDRQNAMKNYYQKSDG